MSKLWTAPPEWLTIPRFELLSELALVKLNDRMAGELSSLIDNDDFPSNIRLDAVVLKVS